MGAEGERAPHPPPPQHGEGPVGAVLLAVTHGGALLLAPRPPHQPGQRRPEALTSEDVEEGVEAAVEEGDALGDLQANVQPVGGPAAVHHPGVRVDGLDQQNDVVWELREEKGGDDHGDDLQRLLLLASFSLEEGVDDQGVANNHDQEWEEEAYRDFQSQDSDPEDHADVWRVHHFAHSHVADLLALAVHDLRDAQADGRQPDGQAHKFVVQEPPPLGRFSFRCLDDGDVPVKTDAG